MPESAGLRDRKKAETRSALGRFALSLAIDRGPDGVTADEIAAAANVSPRTFHNYFGSKEEALITGYRAILDVYVAQLLARPADEPILLSLEHVLGGIAAEAASHREETEAHLELFAGPALKRYRGLLIEEAVRAFTDAVASRTGTDPRTSVYPRLVTMAAVSAVVTAYDLAPPETVDYSEAARRLRKAFALLRSGLDRPQP
jgi:AcrR family transcriptional regulator